MATESDLTEQIPEPRKRPTARRRILLIVIACATLIAGWFFYLGLTITDFGGLIGLKPPLWLRESRYIEVVRDIEEKRLVPGNPTGGVFSQASASFVVQLPSSKQSLTPHGIVFAEERSDGRWFVLFPTWYGFHHDVRGYLYCSEPLTPEDFQLNTGWGIEAVLICGQALKVSHVRGPWYSVDMGLD